MPIKLIAAPHTPFDSHGDLNLDAVAPQAQHLVASGVAGVFISGSTGEGHSLSVDERKQLTEAWTSVKQEAGLMVIVQVGHNCVRDSVALSGHAAEAGADAVSSMAPCYFKPASVDDLVDYLVPIAEACSSLPFFYYDIPSMTGVTHSSLEVLRRGSRFPNLAGVKFTNPDLMTFQECVQFEDGKYEIWFGCDEALLAGYALGARGAVGSTYNFAAQLYHEMIAALDAGDDETARRLQLKSIEMIRVCQEYGYMAAAKSLMSLVGVDCGGVRLPLRNLTASQLIELRTRISSLGVLSASI